MTRAAAALALIACAGVASATPKQRTKPRGTFAAFIEPAALAARAPRPPPPILSVELVRECTHSATSRQADMRERLTRELGPKVADSITITVVHDCQFYEPEGCVQVGCQCFPIEAARHGCPALDVDVANPAKLIFDLRCSPVSITDIAVAIRSRLARRS